MYCSLSSLYIFVCRIVDCHQSFVLSIWGWPFEFCFYIYPYLDRWSMLLYNLTHWFWLLHSKFLFFLFSSASSLYLQNFIFFSMAASIFQLQKLYDLWHYNGPIVTTNAIWPSLLFIVPCGKKRKKGCSWTYTWMPVFVSHHLACFIFYSFFPFSFVYSIYRPMWDPSYQERF